MSATALGRLGVELLFSHEQHPAGPVERIVAASAKPRQTATTPLLTSSSDRVTKRRVPPIVPRSRNVLKMTAARQIAQEPGIVRSREHNEDARDRRTPPERERHRASTCPFASTGDARPRIVPPTMATVPARMPPVTTNTLIKRAPHPTPPVHRRCQAGQLRPDAEHVGAPCSGGSGSWRPSATQRPGGGRH